MGIQELMRSPSERDKNWLRKALQAAVALEFFTIPPYLTAMWSIKEERHYAAETIREVVYEEMQHMALVCNLLVAIGGTPVINRPPAIPVYPRPLPGGVRPDLKEVYLSGLTPEAIKMFMEIEKPEKPIEFKTVDALETFFEPFATIGAFYKAILETFQLLRPAISVDRQVSGPLAPLVIEDLESVEAAIHLIQVQGEGTDVSPVDSSDVQPGKRVDTIAVGQGPAGTSLGKCRPAPDLAHYYRFQELDKGRKLVYQEKTQDFRWADRLEFPEVYPVGRIPEGGYSPEGLSRAVAAELRAFDLAYTSTVDALQGAWESTGQTGLWRGVQSMFSLRDHARALMETRIPGSDAAYGPCFRYLGTTAD